MSKLLAAFVFEVFVYFSLHTLQIINDVIIPRHIEIFVKCLPIFTLMMIVRRQFDSFYEMTSQYKGIRIFIALFTSMIGDAIMVYQNDLKFLIIGILVFMAAHVIYILAYNKEKFNFPSFLIAVSLALLNYYIVIERLAADRKTIPLIKLCCFIYSIAMYLTTWRAWSGVKISDVSVGKWHNFYAGIGSTFFVISDVILATNKFAFPVPTSSYTIMMTYYTAQMLIALSVNGENTSSSRRHRNE